MISNYHHSSGEASGTSPPQYTFDEPAAAVTEGDWKTTKYGRPLSPSKKSSSFASLAGSDAGQSTAESTDSSGPGLSEIVNFLNDLEEQEKQHQKRKKQERKMSFSERSTFSATSSLAYSEGMSTLCYSEEGSGATPTNSEGGATLDGSYLAGTKLLLGSLLGPGDEPSSADDDDDLANERWDMYTLGRPPPDSEHLQKETSPKNGYNQDDYYHNNTAVPPSPSSAMSTTPTTKNHQGNATPWHDSTTPEEKVKSTNNSRNSTKNSSGVAVVPPDETKRTSSYGSNTSSKNTSNNSDASTPVPAEPSPARAEKSKAELDIQGKKEEEEEKSAIRRKKKSTRQTVAEAVEREEESYFSQYTGQDDAEGSVLSRVLCGWDLGDASKLRDNICGGL